MIDVAFGAALAHVESFVGHNGRLEGIKWIVRGRWYICGCSLGPKEWRYRIEFLVNRFVKLLSCHSLLDQWVFLIMELRRCVASEDWFGQKWCIVSLALEIEGSLHSLLNKLMARTVSVHLGLEVLLGLSLYICCQSVPFVFIEVTMFVDSPIERDVIICSRHVPFKLNSIVYKRLLFPHMDLRN